MATNEENDLIGSILGNADPGDTGRNDEGGDDTELDTGPVADDEDEDNQLNDQQDDQQQDDNDEEDAGDDAGTDLDPLAKAAAKKRGRPRKEDQQQDQQPAPRNNSDPFDPSVELRKDKAGNIYAGKDLVARAGREANMFMGFRNAANRDRQAAEQMAQRVKTVVEGTRELYARYETLQSQKTALDKLDLAPEDQAMLIQVASAYKRNPVEGLKLLLTRAHMAGVDIKQLGAGGAIDPKVLMSDMRAYITEALKPVTAQSQQAAAREKLAEEARGFFHRNPRAKDVAKVVGGSHKLGQLLNEARSKAPDLSLDELFERLDYALLRQFGGKLPTAPVADRTQRPQPSGRRQVEKRMENNFRRSVRGKQNKVETFDDIAQSVLRDAQAAAETPRGF